VGDLRNAPTIVRSLESSEGRQRLNQSLARAAELSFFGDTAAAYGSMYKTVARLGPAFFTKFLYVCGDQTSGGPRCLILDSRVAAAMFALTAIDTYAERPAVYAHFCTLVDECSHRQGCTPDEVEFRLYQFGVLIGSRRWRWLHAEASLYRDGACDVGFDDIVARLAESESAH
jgi:hypothetical protein